MPAASYQPRIDEIARLTGDTSHLGTLDTLKLSVRVLAGRLLPGLQNVPGDIVVICTAADADTFAAPLVEKLENSGYQGRVKLHCNWNEPVRYGEFPLSPVHRSYREPVRDGAATLVLAQSALENDRHQQHPPLSGIATAKTNITHIWQDPSPHAVFVVTAVEELDAFTTLLEEFPEESRVRFQKVNLVGVRGPLALTPIPRFVDIPDIVRTRRSIHFSPG